jgi:hypothetical protein
MKKISLLASILFFVILGLSTYGYSTILTFDDIWENPNSIGGLSPEYGGLEWGNLIVGNYNDSDNSNLYVNTGFQNGAVSDGFIAWPNFGGPIDIESINGTFDFIGVYITSGYHVDMNVTVAGYLNEVLLYTTTVVTNNSTPTYFSFNYLGIDELSIISFGGILDEPFSDRDISNRYAILDNFAYNETAPVPEPSTIVLLSTGLLGLVGASRKRFKEK